LVQVRPVNLQERPAAEREKAEKARRSTRTFPNRPPTGKQYQTPVPTLIMEHSRRKISFHVPSFAITRGPVLRRLLHGDRPRRLRPPRDDRRRGGRSGGSLDPDRELPEVPRTGEAEGRASVRQPRRGAGEG